MTLKQEYKQDIKRGYKGTYQEWLKMTLDNLNKVSKVLTFMGL